MNVELTIQEMFDSYPTLFKERADCLSHLFCVIGNGYEWVNGELVECTCILEDIEKITSHLVDGKAHQHNKLSLRAESQYYQNQRIAEGWFEERKDKYSDEDVEELKAIFQKNINTMPDDVYYREPDRKKRWGFYVNIPGHEQINFHEKWAFLFNYPDDIKPDWKEAIEECRRLLIEDGFELPEVIQKSDFVMR